MKLLQEEFFGKLWKFIKGIRVTPIRWIAKVIFYLIILSIFSLVAWMIYAKKYPLLIAFIGIIILGEAAHFIRKSREKVMSKRIEIDNDLEDEAKNPINKGTLVLNREKERNEKKIKSNENNLPQGFPDITVTILNDQSHREFYFFAPWTYNFSTKPFLIITDVNGTPIYYRKADATVRDLKVQHNGYLSFAMYNQQYKNVVMDSAYRFVDFYQIGNGY